MIPDCRTDEEYNLEKLNESDKKFVRGYDWCAEEVVDNFFNNIDVYFEHDSYLMHMLNQEIPEKKHEKYEMVYSFQEEKKEDREIRTYLDLLRARILDWIEAERDELITSMVDADGQGQDTD